MRRAAPAEDHWQPRVEVDGFLQASRTNHRGYGTITRYSVMTDDGMEREVIHGRSAPANAGRLGPTLTVGTAPPLSLGPEGLTMHFLMKSMAAGVDGIVFGPERTPLDVKDRDAMAVTAGLVSFPRFGVVAHDICDRITAHDGVDLDHMLWNGVSLGAMKGIAFAAAASLRNRRVIYSQFVAPAGPNPMEQPTNAQLRRFQRSEMGGMLRLSGELMAHDIGKQMLRLNFNVARATQPGLMMRYARSMPTDRVSNVFTAAWRNAVISGDAGVIANELPVDQLATFELYDRDEASNPSGWAPRLEHVVSDRIRIVVRHGHHVDALRLGNQADRARRIGYVVRQVRRGVGVDELTHPYKTD